jgi:putative N6-adenine-specific DNA methylase
MKPSSYEKRVKRRIIGREHSFFAVCSPGLKKVCLNEMLGLGGQISNLSPFSEDNLSIIQGGIEFKSKLNSCMLFNLNLRSPSKILMRISHFKADSFKKLEKKINAIDWILYLPKNCHLKFNVTTRKSRLYHSDAIAQRCEKIILDQLRSGSGVTEPSGKPSGKAPTQTIWSGTFSLEAAMIKTGLPPGFFRSFAFENWPGFSPKAYSHMKKQAEKNFTDCSGKQIFASDIDEMALTAMEQNISHPKLNPVIDVSKTDFFTLRPSMISPEKKGVVMLNPPYGKRLGEKSDTRSFYREIGKKLTADFKGWRVGIILPSRECKSYLGLKLELKPIYHGGLDIFAGIGII